MASAASIADVSRSGLLVYRAGEAADIPALVALHQRVFGPGRFARTAFRVRERAGLDLGRSTLAFDGQTLLGAVLLTPISINGRDGLWLGPIAVVPDAQHAGIGSALMARAIATAHADVGDYLALVGDPPFYELHGFAVVPERSILLPGPADPARIMVRLTRPDLGSDLPAGLVKPRRT